ncbi:glycosyltransferase family 4 protein [Metabacillus halosaccharovorans]|uniref:Glycosyltransferase family 4 protein n=1 Tax=Metabacillus halosaccharovorans TaxID=930124 RepID=A0ABT3DC98_9BACI|nr:glycosyltransferase family 1 protein [Metabacillus halosaccharovorans]MCV9884491.1 glycosyltransferase family 4 protein [Metabacillus halosaccharovorans]
MKIYINGRFLTQSVTGVQRYAIEVMKALDKLIEEGIIDSTKYQFYILTPNNCVNRIQLKHITIKNIGKLKGHLWEQFELPMFVKRKMLVNLCNAGPILKKNQISVIHDAAVFANSNNFSFLFRSWYKLLLKTQGIFSMKIVTVSEFSRLELIKYLNINEGKIQVIYEGKEHFTNLEEDPTFISRKGIDKKPYVLAVSSLNPNKNFGAIVKAINYLESNDLNIVIAGGTDPKVFSQNGVELPENVLHLGYVSDIELKMLYKSAFCFIYPSFYEGFGLPPLEAMSIGCPIIISNRASLPEVGGEAALYCDPEKPEDIARQIEKLTLDRKLRSDLVQKGLNQAGKFNWEKCAMKLFDLVLN